MTVWIFDGTACPLLTITVRISAAEASVKPTHTRLGGMYQMLGRLEDIAGTIHAHPTLGEAFQESALKALGHALHI